MALSINIRETDGVSILDVAGTLDDQTGRTLFDTVQSLLAADKKNILLNLESLTRIDSWGYGRLVATFLAVHKSGGFMKTLKPSDFLQKWVRLVVTTYPGPVYWNESEALVSFK